MKPAQKGAYMDLLCLQWNQGAISEDDMECVLGEIDEPLRAKVRSKFGEYDEGLYRNERLEAERLKQAQYRQQQSNKGLASAKARFNHGSTTVGGSVEPMGVPKLNSPVSSLQSPSPIKNISFDSVCLANRILTNSDEWHYDNCKVDLHKLKTKPLASVIEPGLARGLSKEKIVSCWGSAVKIAHGANVDGLAGNPTAYCIAVFKEEMAKL